MHTQSVAKANTLRGQVGMATREGGAMEGSRLMRTSHVVSNEWQTIRDAALVSHQLRGHRATASSCRGSRL